MYAEFLRIIDCDPYTMEKRKKGKKRSLYYRKKQKGKEKRKKYIYNMTCY